MIEKICCPLCKQRVRLTVHGWPWQHWMQEGIPITCPLSYGPLGVPSGMWKDVRVS